tara:strand:- start:529 stop:948 length:420 start_codon:yes stop_codon:yes gene_type:complete
MNLLEQTKEQNNVLTEEVATLKRENRFLKVDLQKTQAKRAAAEKIVDDFTAYSERMQRNFMKEFALFASINLEDEIGHVLKIVTKNFEVCKHAEGMTISEISSSGFFGDMKQSSIKKSLLALGYTIKKHQAHLFNLKNG